MNFKRLLVPLTTIKAAAIITIFGFVVFGNALFNGFVLDDSTFILNPQYGHTLNIAKLFGPSDFNQFSYYRPLVALYFAILYALANSHSFFYHFMQIVLHIINAVLIFILFRSLLNINKTVDLANKTEEMEESQTYLDTLSGSQRVKYMRKHGYPRKTLEITAPDEPQSVVLSLLLSLVFLIHPINVESVSYIASSQSELFFLFGVAALIISIKAKISLRDFIIISGLLLLSLLTKETGFLFLIIILLFQLFFYTRRTIKFFLFGLISLAVYFYIRFEIGGIFFSKTLFSAPIPIANVPFLERLTNVPAITLYYLQTSFFPIHLAILQNWIIPAVTFQDFYLPLILDSLFFIACLLVGMYVYRKQNDYFKAYILFSLWFFLGIGMLFQIFPLDMTVADRWFYFPLVGLLGMLGVGIYTFMQSVGIRDEAQRTFRKAEVIAVIVGIIIILSLSLRSIIRNTNYNNELTLLTHDAQLEENFNLDDEIAVDYISQGNFQAAFPYEQRSIQLHPYVSNLLELGYYYQHTGNTQKAEDYYYKALAMAKTATIDGYDDYNVLQGYIQLAGLLMNEHKYKDVMNVSKMGLEYYPNSEALKQELTTSNEMLNTQKAASAGATISPQVNINGQTLMLPSSVMQFLKKHH